MRLSCNHLIVVISLLLFSCGSTSPQDNDNPSLLDPSAGLPSVADLDRLSATVPAQLSVLGREAVGSSSMAFIDNDDMLLPALPGQSSYALYSIHTGTTDVTQVGFELTDTTVAENVWIGAPDYYTGRWSFTQFTVGMNSLDVGAIRSRSYAGNVYIAILTHDDTFTRVKRCYVDLEVPEWRRYTIDATGSPGIRSAMAMIGNTPGIVYERYDGGGTYELVMAGTTSLTPLSPADWNITFIQPGFVDPVFGLDLISVDNKPGMAMMMDHLTPGLTNVWYAHGNVAQPPTGAGWTWSHVGVGVDSDEISLASVDGKPAVAFESREANNGNSIHYGYASRPDPQDSLDWTVVVAADSFDPLYDYSGIRLFNYLNHPALLFYDHIDQFIEYGYGATSTPTGPADFSNGYVAPDQFSGEGIAGIEYGGLPVVLYTDSSGSGLHYARGTSATPAAPEDYNQKHVIDPRLVGNRIEIVRPPLGLGIAYREGSSGSLIYAWIDSGTPGSGGAWHMAPVDDRPMSGDIGLVIMQDGNPGICYHTVNPDALQFAQMIP
ncbi:MAG: hypothetical protein H7A35_09130 [Planctomycetales bacterium]|nr:hypothetical protein [bacterium]UNM07041.1 MAG: hypothetical protein H7A35_09130 [Planctomycetales bacterium]